MPLFSRRESRPKDGDGRLNPGSARSIIKGVFRRGRSPAPATSGTSAEAKLPSQEQAPSTHQKQTTSPISTMRVQGHPDNHITPDDAPEGAQGSAHVSSYAGPYESAYHEAWLSLDEKDRKILQEGNDLKALYASLSKDEKENRERSLFQKGLHTTRPYLEKLRMGIDMVSPFLGAEPTAGTVLNVVKGVVTVSVALCGAAEELSARIEFFLRRVAAFERCSKVIQDGRNSADIHFALVSIFQDVLKFYLLAAGMVRNPRFSLHLALRTARGDISEVIDSFNHHSVLLADLLQMETFATVHEIQQDQIDLLIRDSLESGKTPQRNQLEHRMNEACEWISSDPLFTKWKDHSGITVNGNLHLEAANIPDASESVDAERLLVMFGDMGVGKTMTAAYVVDQLSVENLVCSYYCDNTDPESQKLVTIYRSLLWQLLQLSPMLKLRFWYWHREKQNHVSSPRTQSERYLREFLLESFLTLQRKIVIVLDGLDECENYSREKIMDMTRALLGPRTLCKVFISCRHNAEIEQELPLDTSRIEVPFSLQRDKQLSRHLAEEVGLSRKIREMAIEKLAERAKGSAIWLRIAMEYLSYSRIQAEEGLKDALKGLVGYKTLTAVYGELFKRVCFDIPDNVSRLQNALETLAVAGRFMSVKELACAVVVSNGHGNLTSVSAIERDAEKVDILDLIRPFVSISKVGPSEYVRLVHQSLKDLVLARPPQEWTVPPSEQPASENSERIVDLHGTLLKGCITYLLLDNCGKIELLPSSEQNYKETVFGMTQLDPYADDVSSSTSSESEPLRDFDPFKVGLGNFFTYAASYWTYHFSFATNAITTRDMTALCSAHSTRLNNWVQQWERPRCTLVPEVQFPRFKEELDPLVITAIFGSTIFLADMLKSNLNDPAFLVGSSRTAVRALITLDKIEALEALLRDEALRSALQSIESLINVVHGWSEKGHSEDTNKATWEKIFYFLTTRLREELLVDGNEVLCKASRDGCLPLVKTLFETSIEDPELRNAILVGKRWPESLEPHREPKLVHQSIGEAVWENHTDLVEFLCKQKGTEAHLRYVNSRGSTVFHQAALRCGLDMFKILLRYWPEGINLRDHNDETPLRILIFSDAGGELKTLQLIKFLTTEGGADATGQGDIPGASPLCVSTRGNKPSWCRALIIEGGADVFDVLEINQNTGSASLRDEVRLHGNFGNQSDTLSALCQLFPFTIFVDS